MLVKAKDWYDLLYSNDYIVSSGSSNTKTAYMLSSPNYTIWTYRLTYKLTVSEIQSGATSYWVVKFWTTTNTSSVTYYPAYTFDIPSLWTFNVEKNVNQESDPSTHAITYYVDALSKTKLEVEDLKFYKKIFDWNKNYIDLKPYEEVELWEFTSALLYWNNEGNYKWWIMLSKETSATTWNITPWNFEWYIKVNLNGEIVKIPYYNE